MSKYQIFVGVDVSKDHLDLAIYANGKVAPATRIANTISAIERYLSTFSEKIAYQLHYFAWKIQVFTFLFFCLPLLLKK